MIKGGKIPKDIDKEDLFAWGIEGLIKAKLKFKKQTKVKFTTYAYYRIKGEIFDGIRKEWKHKDPYAYEMKKQAIKAKLEGLLDQELNEGKIKDEQGQMGIVRTLGLSHILLNSFSNLIGQPDNNETYNDTYQVLNDKIETLKENEKKLVELFYNQGYKQKEIAKMLDMTESRVSRMHQRVLDKLKTYMEKNK